MLDFSFAEIALIVVVAVLFIGPDELPVVIRTVAKAIRAIRGFTKELRALFDEVAKESGLDDVSKDVTREISLIKGDDGKMYEAYQIPVPPPVGGGSGGGHSGAMSEANGPHPNPPPNGEGDKP